MRDPKEDLLEEVVVELSPEPTQEAARERRDKVTEYRGREERDGGVS